MSAFDLENSHIVRGLGASFPCGPAPEPSARSAAGAPHGKRPAHPAADGSFTRLRTKRRRFYKGKKNRGFSGPFEIFSRKIFANRIFIVLLQSVKVSEPIKKR
jgi:hypothetical protein